MSYLKVELSGQRVIVNTNTVWTCPRCGKTIRSRMTGQIAQHRKMCATLTKDLENYKRAKTLQHIALVEPGDLARFMEWEDE